MGRKQEEFFPIIYELYRASSAQILNCSIAQKGKWECYFFKAVGS